MESLLSIQIQNKEKSDLSLTVAGTKDAIMMVEAGANEVPEDVMLDAIMLAHEEIKNICKFIEEIQAEIGKEKHDFEVFMPDEEIAKEVEEYAKDSLIDAIRTEDKTEREENIDKVMKETIGTFC